MEQQFLTKSRFCVFVVVVVVQKAIIEIVAWNFHEIFKQCETFYYEVSLVTNKNTYYREIY